MAIRNDKNKIVIESPNTCISTSESWLNGGEECKPVESTDISAFAKDDTIYKPPLSYVYFCLCVKTKLNGLLVFENNLRFVHNCSHLGHVTRPQCLFQCPYKMTF